MECSNLLFLTEAMTGYALQEKLIGALGYFCTQISARYTQRWLPWRRASLSPQVGPDQPALENDCIQSSIPGGEIYRAPRGGSNSRKFSLQFLSAVYFSDQLAVHDIEQLINERLANHRAERHRLLALPIALITEGQQFTVRYALSVRNAIIEFLHGEETVCVAS